MATAPNKQSVVEAARSKYPSAWEKCKHEGDDGEFIRNVARDLNAEDPRWGLNAKRDGASSDISKDVLDYYLGPTDRHVEVFDVIGGHESAGANPAWQNMTNYNTIGNPGTARFVHPVTNGGYSGPPVGGNPNPGVPVYTISEALGYLTTKKGAPLTQSEIDTAINRAIQLGWNGELTIAQSIVHQIGNEMFAPIPSTLIETKLTAPFLTYPIGTVLKIQVG
jgi:hypothetical protein